MSHYTDRSLVEADLGSELIPAVLGDESTGFEALAASVASEIDALLSPAVAGPLEDPIPALVMEAGKVLFCYSIFRRKQVSDDANPFKLAAEAVRERLRRIGRGLDALSSEDGAGALSIAQIERPILNYEDRYLTDQDSTQTDPQLVVPDGMRLRVTQDGQIVVEQRA